MKNLKLALFVLITTSFLSQLEPAFQLLTTTENDHILLFIIHICQISQQFSFMPLSLINKYQMFKALSDGIFMNYALAFELFSVLLLIVIVGISTLNLTKEKTDV